MAAATATANSGQQNPPSPTSESAHHTEKTEQITHTNLSSASDDNITHENDEPKPHLHAKTYLAVFAVCSIYFVQIYNVVGVGAVSPIPSLN